MNIPGASTRVGIILPTYNRLPLLQVALDSALSQSYRQLDIIVIDNGSTDGTAAFMASVNDTRVRYVVNEQNLGLIGSINKAEGLLGEDVAWCTILPDDDLLEKDFVAAMVALQVETGAEAVLHSRRLIIDEHERLLREFVSPQAAESACSFLLNRLRRRRDVFLTGVYFSRKAFAAIGGYPQFRSGTGTDDAFVFALALQDRLYFNGAAKAYVRIHGGAESQEFCHIVNHLHATDDLRRFIDAVAEKSGVSTRWRAMLDAAAQSQARIINTVLIVKKIQAQHMASGSPGGIEEIKTLLSEYRYPVSSRVYLDLFVHKWLRFCPERLRVFRGLWRVIDYMRSKIVNFKDKLIAPGI